ncbi:MAG TPA: redox-sensing transcriptional repressor Rex [Holophaga sp.]|nr:redox-sensing transcriptional repressor Rex [Holophaga sp.]
MHPDPIPEPVLRRLPRYYDALRQLRAAGQETVSTTLLAEAFPDVHPTQIRKDLAVTGVQGRPKVGFTVADLMAAIETFLHWNNRSEAFLVGAGNFGAALVGDTGLWQTGIKVIAAFDISPRKIGTEIRGVRVLPMDKFENLARRMRIPIGILTVPGPSAQACADLMVKAGIRAIWNLTAVNLVVPDGTIVEHVDLFASLAVLGRKLREQPKQQEA